MATAPHYRRNMDRTEVRELLDAVAAGRVSAADAETRFRALPVRGFDDLGFARLEGQATLAVPAGASHPIAPLVGFLGAGVYEEALFRLALIPILFHAMRLLQAPTLLAGVPAIVKPATLTSYLTEAVFRAMIESLIQRSIRKIRIHC